VIVDRLPKLHRGCRRNGVYVELEGFSAHSSEAAMVLKGDTKATLRVVEVDGAEAKVMFQEAGIAAHFPPDRPEGVVSRRR